MRIPIPDDTRTRRQAVAVIVLDAISGAVDEDDFKRRLRDRLHPVDEWCEAMTSHGNGD